MASHLSKSKGFASTRTFFILFLAAVLLIGGAFTIYQIKAGKKISIKDIKSYEKIIGLEFSKEERKMMLDRIQGRPSGYQELRKIEIPNSTPPALLFNPVVPGFKVEKEWKPFQYTADKSIRVP